MPNFPWSNCENSKIRKCKMAKIGDTLNWELEVVAYSKTVQNTSKTSKLFIFYTLELIPVRTHPVRDF